MIGSEINVWGRSMIVCDCDDFTKDFYRNKYGLGRLYFRFTILLNNQWYIYDKEPNTLLLLLLYYYYFYYYIIIIIIIKLFTVGEAN